MPGGVSGGVQVGFGGEEVPAPMIITFCDILSESHNSQFTNFLHPQSRVILII